MTIEVEWVGVNHYRTDSLLWGFVSYAEYVELDQSDLFGERMIRRTRHYVFWGKPGSIRFAIRKYRPGSEIIRMKSKYSKTDDYNQTVINELGMYVLNKKLMGTWNV